MNPQKCLICNGTGRLYPVATSDSFDVCHACKGSGVLWEQYDSSSVPVYYPCYEIHAS